MDQRRRADESSSLPSKILPTGTQTAPTGLTFATNSPTPTTLPSSTTNTSPTSVQSAAPSQTPPPPSQGIPLSTLIPAIVVPIVVVALVAPIALYFFLTRHDRKRSKSQRDSRISSRAYPEPRSDFKGPNFRHSSSETGHSKASEIMHFDLGPGVEKPLPVVNVFRAPDDAYENPRNFEPHRDMLPPIGQAISRYSGSQNSFSRVVDAAQNRTSIQELTEENMRIARLANDSNASFGAREQDEVSDISALGRTSRNVGRRGSDELSDVSSMYEDVTAASSDRGGGILGNQDARRSGPFR